MLGVGDILDDKYQIIRSIGQGRWGRVYLAENLKIGNRWAIKEICLIRDHGVNLLAEPEILKKLNHRSLPRIIDIIETKDFLYIVEDYFEGRNLRELINYRELCNEANVLRWGKQLCEILIYLHELQPNPIIYRDMKPGNVIIDNDNNAKLVDFGIAREFFADKDADSTFIGTIGYAAPEQYSVNQKADERTDIYSLGVTLFHILTGVNPNEYPQSLPSVRDLDKSFSSGINKIIAKCVQQRPENRYQSVRDIHHDLEKLLRKLYDGRCGAFLGRLKEGIWGQDHGNKLVFVEKLIGTMVIAVGGTNRGVGCTYTAITLANFLKHRNYRVAVIEMNDQPVFSSLAEENCCQGLLEGSFRKDGIDFYWHNDYRSDLIMSEVLSAGYNFIILDLGIIFVTDKMGAVSKTCRYDEFNRSNLPIMVTGSAIWQLKDLAPVISEQGSDRWTVVFSAPDPILFNQLKKTLNNRVYALQFKPDPFTTEETYNKSVSEILKPVIPGEAIKGRRSLLWR